MLPLTKNIMIFLITSGALLLVMMLFYPFGYDQAAFSVGGDMVLKNGAVPFRDFLDTKPPFIFYIYSVALFIFGHHDWSIRAFDILFHFAALLYFYKVLVNLLKKEDYALLSCFLYVILYTSSGYWMTAQAETFAIIPSVVVFYHTERFLSGKGKLLGNAFAIGLASTALFFLKSTLMTVPLASLLYLLYQKRDRASYGFTMLSVLLTLALTGSYLYYLHIAGALGRFMEVLEWVRSYADLIPLLSWSTIKGIYLWKFPWHLILIFSTTFLVSAGYCIFQAYKRTRSSKTPSVYLHLGFQVILGLLAVMYERKCFPYHYSRVFWAMSPLVIVGMIELYQHVHERFSSRVRLIIYIAATLLTVVPLYKVSSQPIRWTIYTLMGKSPGETIGDNIPVDEMKMVGDKYRAVLNDKDNIFFWGNHVGVYFFLEKLPTTLILTNTPAVTDWSPPSWRDSMMAQLQRTSPKLFITEQRDYKGFINATDLDSWGTLNAWSSLRDYVEKNYTYSDSVGVYKIFVRNGQ
jgi:hypothetical protein